MNSVAGKIFSIEDKKNSWVPVGKLWTVQCFPLYSILLAVGQTKIDYLSLDIEGSETDVLTNVPWHLVDILVLILTCYRVIKLFNAERWRFVLFFLSFKSLTVEVTSRNVTIRDDLANYMKEQGFINKGLMESDYYYDLVFVHQTISY